MFCALLFDIFSTETTFTPLPPFPSNSSSDCWFVGSKEYFLDPSTLCSISLSSTRKFYDLIFICFQTFSTKNNETCVPKNRELVKREIFGCRKKFKGRVREGACLWVWGFASRVVSPAMLGPPDSSGEPKKITSLGLFFLGRGLLFFTPVYFKENTLIDWIPLNLTRFE